MPNVHIYILEGKGPEEKRAIAEGITEVIVNKGNVPKDAVTVKFFDIKPSDQFKGGIPFTEIPRRQK